MCRGRPLRRCAPPNAPTAPAVRYCSSAQSSETLPRFLTPAPLRRHRPASGGGGHPIVKNTWGFPRNPRPAVIVVHRLPIISTAKRSDRKMTGYYTASAPSPMTRALATTDAAGASFFLHDRTRTSRRGRTRTATSLKIGRWNSIDPLDEYTGNSLIRFIENDTINHFDNLGLITIEYRSISADEVVYGYEKQFVRLDDSTRRQIQHRSGIEVWPSETECFCKDKCGKIIKSYVLLTQKRRKIFYG